MGRTRVTDLVSQNVSTRCPIRHIGKRCLPIPPHLTPDSLPAPSYVRLQSCKARHIEEKHTLVLRDFVCAPVSRRKRCPLRDAQKWVRLGTIVGNNHSVIWLVDLRKAKDWMISEGHKAGWKGRRKDCMHVPTIWTSYAHHTVIPLVSTD